MVTTVLSTARVRHRLDGQAVAGETFVLTFFSEAAVTLGAEGAVHDLDVFAVPSALARRVPSCGPSSDHRPDQEATLGQPVLDIDQCWLWLPVRRCSGLLRIRGPAKVTARVDDEKMLALQVEIRTGRDDGDTEEEGHEPD